MTSTAQHISIYNGHRVKSRYTLKIRWIKESEANRDEQGSDKRRVLASND